MEFAERVLKRIDYLIRRKHEANKTENTLALISIKARLEYEYNQIYKDDAVEQTLQDISKQECVEFRHDTCKKTVLFYDGFGLDTRGLVQIYLLALVNNGYKIIYVTESKNDKEQPEVMSIISKGSVVVYHNCTTKYVDKIVFLRGIFEKHSFSTAFLYTTPWDVSGIVAFNMLSGLCARYQINLTDHAFWLGVNAFDYSIEFRNYGAAISRDFRGISSDRLVYLPYYPIINNSCKFKGFPFDVSNKKVIFSGGAIYKTIDEKNTYYKLVEKIVKDNDDVIFVYASSHTCDSLIYLTKRYPHQVYHIDERKDLIEVLRHAYLFLNTYPMSGGLMLQYAAIAGCIPVTLRRYWDDDALGLLLNEQDLDEVFDDFDKVVSEIKLLLSDRAYYEKKRNLLKNQVISAECFTSCLKGIIDNPKINRINNIHPVDTKKFREAYKTNFSEEKITDIIANPRYLITYKYFPIFLINKIKNKIKNQLYFRRTDLDC